MKPQEPIRPFPYLEKNVTFTNPIDSTAIHGTLTYPTLPGKFPAVILVTGSGAHDRDEEVLGHKPFLVISDYLTKNGIAVLRCDDRHYKMPVERAWSFTTLDLAQDTNAAIDYLKTCEIIDTEFIGLCGHSEGGLISAIIASERNDLSFVISLAGPGQSMYEIALNQSIAFSKNSKSKKYAIEHYEIIKTEPNYHKRRSLVKRLISRHYKWYDFKNRYIASRYLPISISNWSHTALQLTPKIYWEKTTCPVLAICGEYDRQVLAVENLKEIRDALSKGGNTDFEIRLIPKVNHLFQTISEDSSTDYNSMLREYGSCQETISPQVLEILKCFIITQYQKSVSKRGKSKIQQ